jgi:hypothetical protein
VLVGLSSLNPLDFYSGERMDIPALIENNDLSAFRKIVSVRGAINRSPANRIFSTSGTGPAQREIKHITEQLDFGLDRSKVWPSHAISEMALAALINNQFEDFLRERKRTIEEITNSLSSKLAAWGRTDRPSIGYLIEQAGAE